jgi:hypothetical protein
MGKSYLIGASSIVDQKGCLSACRSIEDACVKHGFQPVKLSIDPLKKGWNTALQANHFRSGSAPIEALARALELVDTGEAPAVVIAGEDLLKTAYQRDQRHQMMSVYGHDYPLTTAYADLAKAFMSQHQISERRFKWTAKLLYQNYEKTYYKTHTRKPQDPKWYALLNGLFRGVDCANPNVDFTGRIIIAGEQVADVCGIPAAERIEIMGVGIGKIADGPEHITEIAGYDHLKKAYLRACKIANVDFTKEFLAGNSLLEVYTCYPVVPMAFLLVAEMVSSVEQMEEFLERYEITVTGGMNLARAPWNNSSLNALIVMYQKMKSSPARFGAVHGNGGLGFGQGVAILGKHNR